MLSYRAVVDSYFMPDDREIGLADLIALIDSAKSTIRVICYAFSHKDLLAALVRAFKRGVDLKVILDLTQSKGVSEVGPLHQFILDTSAAIIRIGTSMFRKIIHDKAMSVDSQSAAPISDFPSAKEARAAGMPCVTEGSTNWTSSGFTEDNTLNIIASATDAAAFDATFDEYWTSLSANEPHYQLATAA
jgi:phosphatidylserine/phosphatidylglycerophosphate/cardiolipin synthase-like enzyme